MFRFSWLSGTFYTHFNLGRSASRHPHQPPLLRLSILIPAARSPRLT